MLALTVLILRRFYWTFCPIYSLARNVSVGFNIHCYKVYFFWNIINGLSFLEKVFCVLCIRIGYGWKSKNSDIFWCWTIYWTNCRSPRIFCFMDFGCSVKFRGFGFAFLILRQFFFSVFLSLLNHQIVWFNTSFFCDSLESEPRNL